MYAVKDGEALPVARQRRGVLWCPHCDASGPDSLSRCLTCGAEFVEDSVYVTEIARFIDPTHWFLPEDVEPFVQDLPDGAITFEGTGDSSVAPPDPTEPTEPTDSGHCECSHQLEHHSVAGCHYQRFCGCERTSL